MRVDVVTIFPSIFEGFLGCGIVRRALDRGLLKVEVHDLRDYTHDRHRSVDDAPFGGGGGMVMRPEPWVEAVTQIGLRHHPQGNRPLLLAPQGRRLDQRLVESLASRPALLLMCGRYEAVDERVPRVLDCEEISVGDYVLSGGEPAACVVIDAVTRLLPGALGCETSSAEDSFSTGLLDHPHYTRPSVFRGIEVPEALLSGDHERIRKFRRKESLRATLRKRPDLLAAASLDAEGLALVDELRQENARQG